MSITNHKNHYFQFSRDFKGRKNMKKGAAVVTRMPGLRKKSCLIFHREYRKTFSSIVAAMNTNTNEQLVKSKVETRSRVCAKIRRYCNIISIVPVSKKEKIGVFEWSRKLSYPEAFDSYSCMSQYVYIYIITYIPSKPQIH